MNVLHEMLIKDLQMEQELELTKSTPWGLPNELLHLEKWIVHVEEVVGSCLSGCQWVGWGCIWSLSSNPPSPHVVAIRFLLCLLGFPHFNFIFYILYFNMICAWDQGQQSIDNVAMTKS
jgi:hypothetical protein